MGEQTLRKHEKQNVLGKTAWRIGRFDWRKKTLVRVTWNEMKAVGGICKRL